MPEKNWDKEQVFNFPEGCGVSGHMANLGPTLTLKLAHYHGEILDSVAAKRL